MIEFFYWAGLVLGAIALIADHFPRKLSNVVVATPFFLLLAAAVGKYLGY